MGWPSCTVADADGTSSCGASLTFATVMRKVSLAVSPPRSVAVTTMSTAPTSPFPGVPVKRRSAASKLSHAGSLPSPARAAAYRSVSPASGSVKAFAANCNVAVAPQPVRARAAVDAFGAVWLAVTATDAASVPLGSRSATQPSPSPHPVRYV